jgi:branched-chain amino acid transport system permease protein
MSLSQLLVVPITLVTFALLSGFVNGTHLGARLRAASEQPALAIRSGVNVFRVYVLAWLMAGLAAGLAGVLLGANTSANVSVADVGLRAFPAAVLGGFGSIPGALLGGLVVGLAQQAAVFFIGPTTADVAAYVVMMLALLIRPTGFLGERTIERS